MLIRHHSTSQSHGDFPFDLMNIYELLSGLSGLVQKWSTLLIQWVLYNVWESIGCYQGISVQCSVTSMMYLNNRHDAGTRSFLLLGLLDLGSIEPWPYPAIRILDNLKILWKNRRVWIKKGSLYIWHDLKGPSGGDLRRIWSSVSEYYYKA